MSRRFEALICGRGFLRQGLWGRKVLSDRCLPALRAAAEGAHRRSSGLNRHPLDAGLPVGPLAPDVGCRPARPAKGPPAPGPWPRMLAAARPGRPRGRQRRRKTKGPRAQPYGGWDEGFQTSRMAAVTRPSQIVAIISLRWPQRGQRRASTRKTRCNRAAQLMVF